MDHQPAALPGGQLLRERDGAVVRVELVDAAAQVVRHAGRLVRPGRGAGGDDEVVVGEGAPVHEVHGVRLGFHPVDLGRDEADALVDRGAPRPGHLGGCVGPEGDEQEAGLVVVRGALVHHGDGPL